MPWGTTNIDRAKNIDRAGLAWPEGPASFKTISYFLLSYAETYYLYCIMAFGCPEYIFFSLFFLNLIKKYTYNNWVNLKSCRKSTIISSCSRWDLGLKSNHEMINVCSRRRAIATGEKNLGQRISVLACKCLSVPPSPPPSLPPSLPLSSLAAPL